MLHRALFALVAVFLVACAQPPTGTAETASLAIDGAPVMEAGKTDLLGLPPGYRSVGYEFRGPRVSGLSASTQVWPVSHRWYDVTDEAGIAWPANSGLTWNEKYAAWVDSMQPVQAEDGDVTMEISTPWGKKLPSPHLECAELAMFLRVAFSSWYELPFFMTAWSPDYGNVYSGNFGVVSASGARISGTPNYASAYHDYTADLAGRSDSYIVANWPHDSNLQARYLTSHKDDLNAFLGPDAYAGAYFDELFLDKRVGYFLLRHLTWFGSMHVASANNTWNLQPEALREGDLLLERWQAQGIGHTLVVKTVDDLGGGHLDAEVVFGSMPRIQPVWYSSAIAKSYFTSQYTGGPDTDSNGTPYSHYGGGLKRWRTPVTLNGYWVNIVPTSDRDEWIGSTDYSNIESRIATFQEILGNMTPEEQRSAILSRIEIARNNLSLHPSSCANRERREEAFDELYTLMSDHWGWTRERVDQEYRELDDYVFAELDYSSSKTCCWDSTTHDMYTIIMQYAQNEAEQAEQNGQCAEPLVFKARNGGYDPFRQYAYDTGRGSQWVEWSADETCPQANVQTDTETSPPWTNFCNIAGSVMGWNQCSDGSDPTLWYQDDDGDGFGISNLTTESCTRPNGYAARYGDCDDTDAYAFPDATEYCDAVDNNCDGTVDEGCGTSGGTGGSTGGSTGSGSGPINCGSGCDGHLSGPGVFAWLFLSSFGWASRRRRWLRR